MDALTIERATREQLTAALMRRQDFIGVIVAMPTDFVCAMPSVRDPVTIQSSDRLTAFDVARMLAQATEIVVTKLRVEEKRKGVQQ
jgi:hypothetical protein